MGKNEKNNSKFLVKTKKNMIKLQTKVKKLKKSWLDSLKLKHLVIISILLLVAGYGAYRHFFNFSSPEKLNHEQLKVEIEEQLKQEGLNDKVDEDLKENLGEELAESTTDVKETSSESSDIHEEEGFDRGREEISEAKESKPGQSFKQEGQPDEKQRLESRAKDSEEEVIETGGEDEEFLLPVDGEKTNASQWYKDEVLKVWRFNPGIDIKADAGSEVKAAATGEVKKIKEDDYLGIKVVIKHDSGLETIYFNLTNVDLKQGHQVARGEKIGLVRDNEYYKEDIIRFKIKEDSSYLEAKDYL